MQIELYIPADFKPHPLLFMLHGSAGAFTRHGSAIPSRDNFGEKTFAEHCYVVVLPHYFQVLGIQSLTNTDAMKSKFPLLLSVVKQILNTERIQPFVHLGKVAIYGESLGGFLAIAMTLADPNISAVSVYGTGLPPGSVELAHSRCPPVLIQHGLDDRLVMASSAEDLKNQLLKQGCKVKIVLYPGEMHIFSPKGQQALLERTLQFFKTVFEPGEKEGLR